MKTRQHSHNDNLRNIKDLQHDCGTTAMGKNITTLYKSVIPSLTFVFFEETSRKMGEGRVLYREFKDLEQQTAQQKKVKFGSDYCNVLERNAQLKATKNTGSYERNFT